MCNYQSILKLFKITKELNLPLLYADSDCLGSGDGLSSIKDPLYLLILWSFNSGLCVYPPATTPPPT